MTRSSDVVKGCFSAGFAIVRIVNIDCNKIWEMTWWGKKGEGGEAIITSTFLLFTLFPPPPSPPPPVRKVPHQESLALIFPARSSISCQMDVAMERRAVEEQYGKKEDWPWDSIVSIQTKDGQKVAASSGKLSVLFNNDIFYLGYRLFSTRQFLHGSHDLLLRRERKWEEEGEREEGGNVGDLM